MYFFTVLFVCFLTLADHSVGENISTGSGTFWQISDIHYDSNYSSSALTSSLCLSSEGLRNSSEGGPVGGPFGDYNCDSPWQLIMSAVNAMKAIEPNPHFILWTGDGVPHVPDDSIDSSKVFAIMKSITDLLRKSFPDVPIFPTVGNHDVWPAHQMPDGSNSYYQSILSISGFDKLLGDAERESFKKGGYYSSKLKSGLVLVSVNSNLWYGYDHVFDNDTTDPNDQFSWLESQISRAKVNGEKVLLMGHIPPGVFGRSNGVKWLRPSFNERFHSLLQRYSDVITAAIFGHEHTDGFRVVYNQGSPAVSMFMSPAVTPWFSTLPGAGSNNPGIRLYQYVHNSELSQIVDYTQYFVDLPEANRARRADWVEEYRAKEAFQISSLNPSQLHEVLAKFCDNDTPLFDRYYLHNSVSQDLSKCLGVCKSRQICAASSIDYASYVECVDLGLWQGESVEHWSYDDSAHRRSHYIERFTYFMIWSLLAFVVVLFVVLALCCCNRRHSIVFFRRANYVIIQETA